MSLEIGVPPADTLGSQIGAEMISDSALRGPTAKVPAIASSNVRELSGEQAHMHPVFGMFCPSSPLLC